MNQPSRLEAEMLSKDCLDQSMDSKHRQSIEVSNNFVLPAIINPLQTPGQRQHIIILNGAGKSPNDRGKSSPKSRKRVMASIESFLTFKKHGKDELMED
jgi:hypothetical protein